MADPFRSETRERVTVFVFVCVAGATREDRRVTVDSGCVKGRAQAIHP